MSVSRWIITVSLTLGASANAQDGAKNIILFIADGWGFNHVTATNYYQHGEDGQQFYEQHFDKFAMSTYPARAKEYDPDLAWTSFVYFKTGVTDSAAAATTLASGVKTLNGATGVGPDSEPVPTIVDKAESLGKSTGILSSVHIAHATPASFAAHDRSRAKYEKLASEMIEVSKVDVIMGPGHPAYDDNGAPIPNPDEGGHAYVGGPDTWTAVKNGEAGADADGDGKPDAWTLIESREAFQKLAQGDTPSRVLGIAQIHAALQVNRDGVDDNPKDDAVYQTPLLESPPTLAELTAAALNVLDNNEKGFFMMVEGGAVDWASHANAFGRMIEEMIGYEEAIRAAADWVEANSSWKETLIVVTGDHECGYLTGPDSDPEWNPIVNNGKGNLPGFEWHSTSHTNQLIPLFVKGAGAERFKDILVGEDKRFGDYTDNAEVGKLMIDLLR